MTCNWHQTCKLGILDVVRIESQTFKLEISRFELNQAVENIVKEVMARQEWEKVRDKVKLIFEPKNPIFCMAMSDGLVK